MPSLFDPDSRPIIAHRGASGSAPENTIEAFDLAMEHGAEALEFDVRITLDGVPVVIHDPTLLRTTGESGRIADLTFEQVQRADAGACFSANQGRTFPWRNRGVRVPTLEAVLTRFPGVPYVMEIKDVAAADPARAMVERLGARDRCLLMSFEPRALDTARARGERTGATTSEALALIRSGLLGHVPARVPYQALSVPERWHGVPIPMRALARAARRLACPVHVWVVDSPARARELWAKGVAGVVTNFPRTVRDARDHHGQNHT